MSRLLVIPVLAMLSGAAAPVAAQGTPSVPPLSDPPPPQALSPLDAYAEAAATTILAEQHCGGMRLQAGRLTTLRLAAKVTPAQEAPLEQKLRDRATSLRQSLAADGRAAWCANAFAAFGPEGSIARGVLAH